MSGGGPRRRLEADRQGPRHRRRTASIARNGIAELFNLADDPNERRELAASNPRKVAELRAIYESFEKQSVPPKSAPRVTGFRSPNVWGEFD